MATITQTRARCRDNAGIRARRVVTITGPASYVQPGGDPLTPEDVFLGMIEYFPPTVVLNASGAAPRLVIYDYTNNVLLWFVPNTGSEVANAVDLSAYSFHVEIIGKG